ncbi:2086_t:CDS:2 [Diversispora eburnea]|uniref:2086_t:CDS:1 n=1 Tax=Diversispora eburnea TaxID=1213867 RepID=A0A9N8Z1C0_9GLOM|nr:2086_t:CDS:2 [Diversispora eburnea]
MCLYGGCAYMFIIAVCEECGLAHYDKIIDTRSEWRTFSKFHGKEEIESICHSMDLSTKIIETTKQLD